MKLIKRLLTKVTSIIIFFIAFAAFVSSNDCLAQVVTTQEFKKNLVDDLSKTDNPGELLLKVIEETAPSKSKKPADFKWMLKIIIQQADFYNVDQRAEIYTLVGKKMHYNRFYEDAFYYLYKSNKIIADKTPRDTAFYPFLHESYGLSLYYYRRYNDAKREFKIALKSKTLNVKEQIGIYNSLGLVYRDIRNIDSARYYFTLAFDKAKKHNDEGWKGVLSGNLGHLFYLQGDFQKAEKLVMYDYRNSQNNNQVGSAINAGLLMIRIRIQQGRVAEAQKLLTEIEAIVFRDTYRMDEFRVLYKARNLVYQAQGNYKDALESFKIASLYDDTLRSLTTEENLKKTEFQINFEQKQSELSLVREKERFNEWMIIILSLLVGLIVVSSVLIIRGIIRKRKRENQLLELKQEKVERELAHTEKEMRFILSNLIEKNALVEQLSSEIEGFQNDVDSKFNEERSKMLGRLQSITLLTDDDWLEFKKLFERLNPNFFSRLLLAAPDLTNAEIRLVTLIKLNLSNLEMARVLGISPDSVRKTALRLRKKWNIDQQEELVKFVLNL